MNRLFTRQLWQQALTVQRSHLTPWPALREAVGIALVYLVVWNTLGPLGKPLALAAAAGALMAGIASVGGPSRTRGRALLMMTGMLGLSVALGLLVGEQALLAAAVVGVFAFGFAMIAAANPLYVSLATISVSYMVSYASQGLPAELWWSHGLAIVVGGLLQMFYLNWMWSLPPMQPEREQIAGVYRDVAASVRQLPGQPRPGLMLHHSDALAQAQVITVERYHSHWQTQQRELTWLLDALYDLDAALTGYGVCAARWLEAHGGVDEDDPTPQQQQLTKVTDHLAELLEDFAGSIESGTARLSADDWQAWQAALAEGPSGLEGEAKSVLRAAAHLHTGFDTGLSVQRRALEPIWRELTRPWHDPHGVQFAAYYGLAIGVLTYVSHLLPWENSSLLVMTFALIFTSDYQQLLTRGVARVAGTLAALALILLLQEVIGLSDKTSAAILLLSSFLVIATLNAGYLAVTLGFTVYSFAALNSWEVEVAMPERMWLTALGVLAAVIAYHLWPNWQVRSLPRRYHKAAEALCDFLESLGQVLDGREDASADAQARHADADELRRALLRMGAKFRHAAQIAQASRTEPIWDTLENRQTEQDPFEQLEELESLAAEAVGLHSALQSKNPSTASARRELNDLKQRLTELQRRRPALRPLLQRS